MSASKHTPGPWQFDQAHRDGFWIGNSDTNVARIYGYVDHPQIIANARLIAAAPELEDFARNVAGFDDRLLVSADLNILRATLREFRDQARAAIAKATGTDFATKEG